MKSILYAISDRHQGGDFVAICCALLLAGVDWLQVREKDLPDGELCRFLAAIAPAAHAAGAKLLINGRPDLALATGASGVHLPANGLPTTRVRALCPSPFLLLRSCHSLKEVLRAQADGADAVTLGPIFATPSKVGFGEPFGLARLAEACRSVDIPVLGLGGIGSSEVPAVLGTGAAGVAGIRLFWSMGRPDVEVPALRRALAT